jgi:hypothetical protein
MLDPRAMRFLAIAFTSSVAIASATAMLACGARRLPGPSYVGQPQEALVQVPYPPPPARVEFVPEQPNGDAVWIDGEWVWQGRRYAWKPGRWVKPPANAAFAPWATVRDTMGSLYIAEGTWRDHGGNEVAAPTPLRSGTSTPGAITGPEGDTFSNPATQLPDASTVKPDGAGTDDPRAPRELFVDAGDFKVDASQLPDGSLQPDDASLIPDGAGFDATFDAMPETRARMKKP